MQSFSCYLLLFQRQNLFKHCIIARRNHLVGVIAAKIPAFKLHLFAELIEEVDHQVGVVGIHVDKPSHRRAALVGDDDIHLIVVARKLCPRCINLAHLRQLLRPPGSIADTDVHIGAFSAAKGKQFFPFYGKHTASFQLEHILRDAAHLAAVPFLHRILSDQIQVIVRSLYE